MLKKILIICLLIISGCSLFEDKRAVVKPKIDSEMIQLIIKHRYQREESLRKIEADRDLQEYLLLSKPNNAIVSNDL